MITFEVDDLAAYWADLEARGLPGRLRARIKPPTDFPGGARSTSSTRAGCAGTCARRGRDDPLTLGAFARGARRQSGRRWRCRASCSGTSSTGSRGCVRQTGPHADARGWNGGPPGVEVRSECVRAVSRQAGMPSERSRSRWRTSRPCSPRPRGWKTLPSRPRGRYPPRRREWAPFIWKTPTEAIRRNIESPSGATKSAAIAIEGDQMAPGSAPRAAVPESGDLSTRRPALPA